MSLAGDGGVIKKRAVAADAVPGTEDGELIPPARKADGGDPGGEIRLVRLERPGAQRVINAAAARQKIADGGVWSPLVTMRAPQTSRTG